MPAPRVAVVGWFALLCASSVGMTLGNKWLVSSGSPLLIEHKWLLVCLQNIIAVSALGLSSLMGLTSVGPLDRKQTLYYVWDAFVLVLQLWFSFESLRHLPVSTTTVVRALAIPLVAWSELVVLGQRLSAGRQLAAWVVVLGAAAYAYEDLVATEYRGWGYLWSGANLLAYTSNSLLDRLMMSQQKQTASGMALCTQALSIPISVIQGCAFHGFSTSVGRSVMGSLDGPTAVALLVTGLGAGVLGSCFAQCYQVASATAVTVAGNVNKALSVLVSFLAFGATISLMQMVGMGVCLAGAFAYSLLGVLEREEAKDSKAS